MVKREQHCCRMVLRDGFLALTFSVSNSLQAAVTIRFQFMKKTWSSSEQGFPSSLCSKAKVAVDFLSWVPNTSHLTTLPCPWGKCRVMSQSQE